MRRPRVMRARIRAMSLVPKRTLIQKAAPREGRRVRILGHLLGAGDEFAEDAAQAAGARR